MSVDFWIGVGVVAGIYGIFALGLQINVGFTGLLNLGQAGFMSIGAYAMGMLVVDAGWSIWAAMPAADRGRRPRRPAGRAAVAAAALRLFRHRHHRVRRDRPLHLPECRLRRRQPGHPRLRPGVARRSPTGCCDRLARIGLGGKTQLPLFLAVWIVFLLCLAVLRLLQASPWGRVLRAIREDEDAAAALGKNVLAYKLQSLGIAAALAAIAGFFLSLNVTYLYPSEFDPTFTFFGYAVLILGGFASYGGVALGTVLLWSVMEGLRFLHLPLSAGQLGSLRFVLVGLVLVLLSMLRPQGLLGRKAEMQLRQ